METSSLHRRSSNPETWYGPPSARRGWTLAGGTGSCPPCGRPHEPGAPEHDRGGQQEAEGDGPSVHVSLVGVSQGEDRAQSECEKHNTNDRGSAERSRRT